MPPKDAAAPGGVDSGGGDRLNGLRDEVVLQGGLSCGRMGQGS
ncbi:unnamed protein product, partial [Urochloa humidicola]